MYLSRLILNPRNRFVQRDIGDIFQMHRTILKAFPSTGHSSDFRKDNGVLYRVDLERKTGLPLVLVQSSVLPDWSFLKESGNYLSDDFDSKKILATKPVSGFYEKLSEGQVLLFRLRANVTRKIDTKTGLDGKKRNGRRVPLRQPTEMIDWLKRKGSQGGFELVGVAMDSSIPDLLVGQEIDQQSFSRKNSKDSVLTVCGEKPVTFSSVVFEGKLRITHKGAFLKTLVEGVGSGKAFGFGLLSIAPL